MIVTTITDTRHTLHFEGLTEHGFTFRADEDDRGVLLRHLTVTVIVDAEQRVRPMEVLWSGTGAQMLANGTVGQALRKPSGSNLNRLPADLREVVLDAIENLGAQGLREDLDRLLTPSQRTRMLG